jgi:carbon storage regulator CsrA
MIVLSRKRNESIVIANNITVTVVDIRGDKVRLAISAPAEIPIHRKEVYDAIHDLPRPPAPRPRSPEEMAFVQAVLEAPDDEAIRLIFADWLEERGDPLGEFIRTQCRLARLPADDPRRKALTDRERVLWAEHGAAWRLSLPPVLREAPFERGFVEAVHLTVSDFLASAAELFAAAPVRRLRVQRPWSFTPASQVPRLASSPYLASLAELDVSEQDVGDDGVALLATSPHVTSLKTLLLRGNGIGDAGAVVLANSSVLAGLSALDLEGNRIGRAGAQALAASPYLANLLRLNLAHNPLGDDGVKALQTRFGVRVRVRYTETS